MGLFITGIWRGDKSNNFEIPAVSIVARGTVAIPSDVQASVRFSHAMPASIKAIALTRSSSGRFAISAMKTIETGALSTKSYKLSCAVIINVAAIVSITADRRLNLVIRFIFISI